MDQSVSFWQGLSGLITSDYGDNVIILSPHREMEGSFLFGQPQVNQKIRVYGDYLRESFPGRISVYAIEIIE